MATEKMNKVLCKSEAELKSVAELLFSTFPSGRFFSFFGEMGAGKTTFIKFLCERLDCVDTVNSPTFSIVNVYKTKNFNQIFHFDFYRMKTIEEVYDIGYEDYFFSSSYCFVEWPEKIESLLPDDNINVFIEVDINDGTRIIMF